jgi:ATP-dependent DNA ligase
MPHRRRGDCHRPERTAVFDLIRGHRPSQAAVLCAFDLLELDGEDLRREPIETRKSTLKSLLRGKHAGIAFNAALGCEGIVSKRLGSPYRSGRADCWVKVKNPAAPAVTREAEEDWNGKRNRKTGGNQ